jgi:serine/threonine protein kinase
VAVGHPRTLPVVRGYTLLGELGQGGMGTVYLARQERLGGRPVALKVLAPSVALSPSARERFRTEGLAIARLRHPNIVAVHDVVHDADIYAYAMEWVDGKSLAELINALERCTGEPGLADVRAFLGTPSGVLEQGALATFICGVGIAVARALGEVHRAGLLHRDVKPANVLLRRDGTPLLSDFGLARDLDTATLTQAGHFVGTPAYAAPEQLRGSSGALDARTDVYGLGVTLYHALTLRLPFSGTSTADLLRKIEAGQAEPLRRANPHLSADLQTIVAKAMDADPARRYQTADALADDLERLLHLQPIRGGARSDPRGFPGVDGRDSHRWVRLRGAQVGRTTSPRCPAGPARTGPERRDFRQRVLAGYVRQVRRGSRGLSAGVAGELPGSP